VSYRCRNLGDQGERFIEDYKDVRLEGGHFEDLQCLKLGSQVTQGKERRRLFIRPKVRQTGQKSGKEEETKT
jgi:hypothetical protein